MANEKKKEGVTRRDFMKVAAVGAGGAGVVALGFSSEAKAAVPPTKWDMTTDVVVAGAGVGGFFYCPHWQAKQLLRAFLRKGTGRTGRF